jgi:formylglycine-generating enzyme required for sulfatase activity
MTNCGSGSESCCASPEVAGGNYDRTYANDGGGPGGEADPATVSGFRLDAYEVTVARFRQFVAAWKGGWAPPAGSGKHTHLNGGKGLANTASAGTYETGWLATDDGNVQPTDSNLGCDPTYATWTPAAGGNENRPINCVTWYEAYAFCIWDGGFLPSEAEWECAAAGGNQEREYPWGSADPGTESQYAIYYCDYPTPGNCSGATNIAPVGTPSLGAGAWGQLDLAGNVWEWTLDWYVAAYDDPSADGAHLSSAQYRVFRSGTFLFGPADLVPTFRNYNIPPYRGTDIGIRCARSP